MTHTHNYKAGENTMKTSGLECHLSSAPTVFVTQENPRLDLVSAMKWGNLDSLCSPHEQVHINPTRTISHIQSKLRNFSDDDWLLAMGDPAIIGIAFAIAADINRGNVNLLKWDKIEQTYYPVRISVFDDVDGDNEVNKFKSDRQSLWRSNGPC